VPKLTKISLVIPAYNEEHRLRACLDSVARQTVRPHEVLVVNNASTDRTAEVAREFSFVTLLHEPRRGRVFARNAGFNAASGDVIARIDADALLPADWTKKVATYFASPEAQRTTWTGGALFYNVRFPRLVSGLYNLLVFRFNQLLVGHPTLWGSNMALPTALWAEVRPDVCLRDDIHEDLDLAIHLRRRGYRVVYDKHVKTQVQLRRVRSNRQELWAYLQMWPRTLRVHGIWTWPICWFFGDFLLYLATPLFGLAERIARLFGKKPLEE
jgi:glycosyltransferase involved in cell wall biosynthesis